MTSFYGGGAASTSGGSGSSAKGALIFKGALGISDDGATVLALPDTHEEGWTYLVVTAGTYAGQLCEKGDFVICVSSGESASNLDWTVVQGNTFSTLPTPTALDEGKIIVVGADGNYTLIDNPADNKLDKNNGTATGTTTFDKAQANRLELLVDGESIGGFRSIDLTPAVTDNGDDSSMRFVPLFIGEPTKNAHAATKKYVDDKVGNYLPLAGGTMTGSINAGENTVTNLKEPENGTDATTKNYVDGEVAKAAPVSIMPIPEVEGQNLITVNDSVEWPLQGMKVYGKSAQLTTTGAQLFDISKATPSWDSYGLHITFEDDYIRVAGTATNIPSDGKLSFRLLNVPGIFPAGSTAKVFDLTGISPNSVGVRLPTYEEDPYMVIAFSSSEGAKIDFKFRLMVSLKAPTQWEPYTGGKPSPAPAYPQPIVSAGDGGSIDLTLCGANLLPSQDILDYYVKANGTSAGRASGNYSKVFQPDDGQTYYIRRKQAGTRFRVACVNELPKSNSTVVSTANVVNDTAQEISLTANAKYMIINLEDETAFDELMVSFEPNAQYEPYKSQSPLTISTPNGLPGIPVDSGGNYTDAEGQQRACDVKDYSIGKYTQMVGHIESYNGETITTPYISTTGQLSTGAEVYYVLDEPVVMDISAEELAAYRALHTYDGATVVSTNENIAGLKVKYVAKVIDY